MSEIKIVSSLPCEEWELFLNKSTPSNLQQSYYYGEVMKIFDPHCGVLRLSARALIRELLRALSILI